MCPGIRVIAPESANLRQDDVFGPYVSSWVAWAIDPEVRNAGSSAGVITALSNWLIDTKRSTTVIASKGDETDPRRTVPLNITSRDAALAAAGSRYAPVANTPLLNMNLLAETTIVGKPCEASAIVQLSDAMKISPTDRPIILSFFCAGTPSQFATDSLAELLQAPPPEITSLKYRGDGWPGTFRIGLRNGQTRTMSYDESWGTYLGRTVQWRCKLCVDGTGGHSDIAVGDYWDVDSRGYPVFENAEGRSVVIARTKRGAEILELAASEGIISRSPLDLHAAAAVQPLQTDRKLTLAGRLFGRRLAGKRIPVYRGYSLIRITFTAKRRIARAAAGTFIRSRQTRD
ncbi:Coenzyme F420 hydrogenase/dehydrogenase, beta subunit C-terminal domain [Rhodococcus sp. G-MC3]|uniref:Coenzyme F420 hydrogenase/dehydrogenase, beta subunit C-terminal domain n=1 Tax=Rhodococcus sp. G-MC3 TaxID=3046209 RepID=UPI0024B966D9|nr:Coenzyme F420 hydrogenase/dehydrogenase, beta subunit C-terminal domain [Rhodococcus sp. G-MC3]MDJ0396358.1 Coenzyme F420 hydrogenase/dehydrogenase, beta subunit C-terminal domain [Rhodococcus sp. G-MC3]